MLYKLQILIYLILNMYASNLLFINAISPNLLCLNALPYVRSHLEYACIAAPSWFLIKLELNQLKRNLFF